MKIHPVTQGSPEWQELHRGRVTASRFDRIVTPKTGALKSAAQLEDFIAELVAETLGGPMAAFDNGNRGQHVFRGNQVEPDARRWYEMEKDCDVQQVGFVTTDDGAYGCSPDGLIDLYGGLELKSPSPKIHIGYVMKGVVPADYLPQVHASLAITDREWWDFVSYCPGLPRQTLLIRVTPNEYTANVRKAMVTFRSLFMSALNLFVDGTFRDTLKAAVEEVA